MARVIMHAGKVILVVVIAIFLMVTAFLSIYSLAGSGDESAPEITPVESSGPVVLSETREEVANQRGRNQRTWRVTRQVEFVDPKTEETAVEEVVSTIVEVGDGICYQDELGDWKVSEPTWRTTEDGFVLEKAGYALQIGSTIDSWLWYQIEEDVVQLKPTAVVASDGTLVQDIGVLNPRATGQIDPNDAACLVFAGAFGKGIDLKLKAGPGGYHQNVVFHERPRLNEDLDPAVTRIRDEPWPF